MRDYSFGNFISALRERLGLSQYHLGALVGVTDKAVSKWENGAAKPRIDTIRKLAEILDVSVDELLTCEYATFNEERKDLFAMKNEIIKMAKNKMLELYGDNPPVRIVNRFKTEELMLTGQDTLLWMGFFGRLYERFYTENAYFDVRGAQIGASFIAWLLCKESVNPLPAHYYCPVCKRVEFASNGKCGVDLPDKKCSCGNYYQKDGFGIAAANMYPFTDSYEIYVSKNTTKIVANCLDEYFKGYGELREIKINYDGIEVISPEKIAETKFGLFSKDKSKQFPEQTITVQFEEFIKRFNDVPLLTVIENAEEHISFQDLSNVEISAKQIKDYASYAVEKGKLKDDVSKLDLGKILSDVETPTFSDLLSIYGLLFSAGTWTDNAEILYDKGIPLGKLISCREDVYEYLYDKLDGICCDNPSGLVFEIKENLRKGKYTYNRMPAETEHLLLECEVPEWYIESMKKIMYLLPKTSLIMIVKREICRFIKGKF